MNKQQWLALGIGFVVAMLITISILCLFCIPYLGNVVLALFGTCAAVAIGAMYIGSLIWVYRDAKHRDRPPEMVTVMVALCVWPLGLLVWYKVRPPELALGEYKSKSKARQTANKSKKDESNIPLGPKYFRFK